MSHSIPNPTEQSNIPYGYCHCGCGQLAAIAKLTNSKMGYVKGKPTRFAIGHRHMPIIQRDKLFWEKVDKRGPDECWEWTASLDGKGYGRFWNGARLCQAHRYSYELHHGKSLGDLFGCHSCDNPKCVNPNHIFPGTQTDNLHDMMDKGRRYQPDVSGTKNGRAKLNDDLVREARQRHTNGQSVSALARAYGVGWTAMDLALRGETWPNA